MAGLSQKLKAIITFGGSLDPTWRSSADSLRRNLNDVGKQSEKLVRTQARLAAELRRAKLAGENIEALKRQYSDVTHEIRRAEAEQQRLNRAMQRAERLSRYGQMGRGLLRRGAGFAGSIGSQIAPGLAIGGGGVVASALGALISPTAFNANTAEKAGLAKSYGVGIDTYNAWNGIASMAGLNGENMGDLFEEYKNKVSDYKDDSTKGPLKEALPILNFKAGDFAHMNNQQQVEEIFKRLLALKDDQIAAGTADKIFGGEGNKLITFMRMSGKSYKDLMEEQRRYNLVTKEGAEGAIAGSQAVKNLQTVFTSALAEVSGQLGTELAPDIRKLTEDLAVWFRNGGITKITNFMRRELYPSAVAFGGGLVYVGKIVYALAKRLSWLLPDDEGNKKAILSDIAQGGSVDIARLKAKSDGLGDWFTEKVDRPEVVKNLRQQWSAAEDKAGFWASHLPGDFRDKTSQSLLEGIDGKKSAGLIPDWDTVLNREKSAGGQEGGLSSLLNELSARDKGRPQITNNNRPVFNFEINANSADEGKAIADDIEGKVRSSDIFSGNNEMYDLGVNW